MLTIVIPALNVEETIENVIVELSRSVDVGEIIVVDNLSSDNTASIATGSGARVVSCKKKGMGNAIIAGVLEANNNAILKIDGDIRNPTSEWVDMLVANYNLDIGFVSSTYSSDYDEFPVGTLVAGPLLKLLCPHWEKFPMPLAGTYLFNRDRFFSTELPGDWSFDLALHLNVLDSLGSLNQIYIGELNDRRKKISEYSGMAEDLMRYLLNRYGCYHAIQETN